MTLIRTNEKFSRSELTRKKRWLKSCFLFASICTLWLKETLRNSFKLSLVNNFVFILQTWFIIFLNSWFNFLAVLNCVNTIYFNAFCLSQCHLINFINRPQANPCFCNKPSLLFSLIVWLVSILWAAKVQNVFWTAKHSRLTHNPEPKS